MLHAVGGLPGVEDECGLAQRLAALESSLQERLSADHRVAALERRLQDALRTATEDAHLLMAALHRQAMVVCHVRSGRASNGLTMAAKDLGMTNAWRRRMREWDTCLGIVEKLSSVNVAKHIDALKAELDRM